MAYSDSEEEGNTDRREEAFDEDDDIVVRPGRRNRQAVAEQQRKAKDTHKRRQISRRSGGATGDYSWTSEYQRSWDTVQEDEFGSIAGVVAGIIEAGKRKRLLKDATPVQRGIIRHLVLALDFSSAMAEKDLRPSRHELTINYACDFVSEFFEQNPISQLAVIGMRDGVATMVSQLGGNPQDHINALRARRKTECTGDASLQNALEMARATLFNVPSHGTRELLMVYGSLVSSDPGDVRQTIGSLVNDKIRVRIVGLSASLAICREIVKQTNGGNAEGYGVILDEHHYKELLMQATTPPAAKVSKKKTSLIMVGFPSRTDEEKPTLCACHARLTHGGYHCPRCASKVCSLPAECPVCNLTLILSTHLARSYHHLFPLRNWEEVDIAEAYLSSHCFACQTGFPQAANEDDAVETRSSRQRRNGNGTKPSTVITPPTKTSSRYACPQCRQHFCIECDVFAHEVMFECPGCQAGARGRALRAERRQKKTRSVRESAREDSMQDVPDSPPTNGKTAKDTATSNSNGVAKEKPKLSMKERLKQAKRAAPAVALHHGPDDDDNGDDAVMMDG
ncbi:hypothetical protein PYCC9005_002654 [Savitreella phatthalungensis]